ncbi:AVID protein, partial [Galbula dea]|nr:AVID protein [Galbula dea]
QGTHMTLVPQCHLQGLWQNELGSSMTPLVFNVAGPFSGSYHTTVAATNKEIWLSPVQGTL